MKRSWIPVRTVVGSGLMVVASSPELHSFSTAITVFVSATEKDET